MAIALAVMLISCEEEVTPTPEAKEFNFDFTSNAEGWSGDFADYPIGQETFYELAVGHDSLPSPLDLTDGALMQTGNNHSDDLFMFVKKKLTGLSPNQLYKLSFTLEIATDAAEGSVGVGGSPANSVYIKVGASQVEPQKEVGSDDHYRMNIDKSNQSQSGQDMVVIGDFSNGTDKFEYKLVQLKNDTPFEVETDSQGEVWVVVGTDSGFEATTTIYYNSIAVKFE